MLSGNNSGFTGTWDLTQYSTKYPTVKGYFSYLEGANENVFGASQIAVGQKNKLIISHERAAYPKLTLTLTDSAKVVLNKIAIVSELWLNGQSVAGGTYSATNKPLIYEGTGAITVIGGMGMLDRNKFEPVRIWGGTLRVNGENSRVEVYNVLGSLVYNTKNVNSVQLNNFLSGIYLVKYVVDGQSGILKFAK